MTKDHGGGSRREQRARWLAEGLGAGLGLTGDFPDGKTSPDDEGGLHFAVGCDNDGNVVVDFGTPVVWLAMTPADAHAFAAGLLEYAHKVQARAAAPPAPNPSPAKPAPRAKPPRPRPR